MYSKRYNFVFCNNPNWGYSAFEILADAWGKRMVEREPNRHLLYPICRNRATGKKAAQLEKRMIATAAFVLLIPRFSQKREISSALPVFMPPGSCCYFEQKNFWLLPTSSFQHSWQHYQILLWSKQSNFITLGEVWNKLAKRCRVFFFRLISSQKLIRL